MGRHRYTMSRNRDGSRAVAAELDAVRQWYAQGNLEEAIRSLHRVLALNPKHPEALILREEIESEFCQSEDYFRNQFRVRQGDASLHRAYANYLYRTNRFSESIGEYRAAISLEPGNAIAYFGLGRIHCALGRPEEAKHFFQEALVRRPDYIDVKYFLAGLTKGGGFAEGKLEYVTRLFDSAADTFDAHLVQTLHYEIPEQIRTAFDKVVTPAVTGLDILDLGCGTGLSGLPFRSLARNLTGIDLSSGMLNQARLRGVYDQLLQGDVVEYLQDKVCAYDLVIAADLFIYIGGLGDVFRSVAGSLRKGGYFTFSVESFEGIGYILQGSARYAHSSGYISELAARHGFKVLFQQDAFIRQDSVNAIGGIIFILQGR